MKNKIQVRVADKVGIGSLVTLKIFCLGLIEQIFLCLAPEIFKTTYWSYLIRYIVKENTCSSNESVAIFIIVVYQKFIFISKISRQFFKRKFQIWRKWRNKALCANFIMQKSILSLIGNQPSKITSSELL